MRLRDRPPRTSFPRFLFYEAFRRTIRLVVLAVFRARAIDLANVPAEGPLLVAANHQSFLDPPVIGSLITARQMTYVARAGLFRFTPFARTISWLNAIPVREDQGDAAAIKATVRALESGAAVLIFPEGSRSDTGAIGPFKRGVALLVKKARCPVLPVAIEGAFDRWPRARTLPTLIGPRVLVKYGRPIPYDELMRDGPDAALARIAREVDALHRDLLRLREGRSQ